MRFASPLPWLSLLAAPLAVLGSEQDSGTPAKPGKHVLTIEGENNISFRAAAALEPAKVEYRARIEYLVKTRNAQEVEADSKSASKKKTRTSRARTSKNVKKAGGDDEPEPTVASAVDIAIHAAEMDFLQNGQTVVQSRISRSRFQGRFMPDAPVLSVNFKEAPPPLQALLKRFDVTAASVYLDHRARVLRRQVNLQGPLHAITETLLSIHTPIPTDSAFWEAPTQLAMGHNQTAKGMLRFEKDKGSVASPGGLVRVKVSGVLKAEGAIVGNFIKDGRYTVSGEQHYDPKSREWTSAKWNVDVANDLANAAGVTVAHANGKMVVESKMIGDGTAADGQQDADTSKP